MMNIEALLAYVREHFPNRYGEKVPMAQYTSFHIGGPADLLVAPESVDELQGLLKEAKKYAVPTFILGNGSNLLVRDGGIRGLVIKLGNHLNGLSACGVTMEAGAGVSLAQAARFAAESGLSGLEFAVGIPGSLGGAVIMNAGAYDGDMGHVVKSVTALNGTGEIVRLTQKDLDFSYRHSALQYQDLVVLSVSFVLKPEEQQIIEAKMADFSRRRRTKQPLDYPSAG
ncbi:putative UDP-N-acetylmuramate dehydrogenase, partial [Acidaminococcus intestini]